MNGKQQTQFEMLNEITKVAAIKATSALSKILELPIGVDIIPVEKKRLDEIQTIMKTEEKIVGLSVPILSPLPGACLLIYTESAALSLCDTMYHRKEGESKQFNEKEISALTEAANIVIGNFLTSFAIPLQIDTLLHRAAQFNRDNFANFIEEISLGFAKNIQDGLIVEIAFHFQHLKIQGLAIFLFDSESMTAALAKVGV